MSTHDMKKLQESFKEFKKNNGKIYENENLVNYVTVPIDKLIEFAGGETNLLKQYYGEPEKLKEFLLQKQEEYIKTNSDSEHKYIGIPYMHIKHYAETLASNETDDLINYAGGLEYLKTNFEIPETLKEYLIQKQEEYLKEKNIEDPGVEHLGLPYMDIKKLAENIIKQPNYPLYMLKNNVTISRLYERFYHLKNNLKKDKTDFQKAITKEHIKDLLDRIQTEVEDMVFDYDIERLNNKDEIKKVAISILNIKPSSTPNNEYSDIVNKTIDRSTLLIFISNKYIKRLIKKIKDKQDLLFNLNNKEEKDNSDIKLISDIENDIDMMEDELKTHIDDVSFKNDIYVDNDVIMKSLLGFN